MVKKVCIFPKCETTEADGKIMISVPRDVERRTQWFALAGIKRSLTSALYCCEDHFELEEDAENWQYYKHAGKYLKLKPHVVPHLSLGTPRRPSKKHLSDSEKKRKIDFLSTFPPCQKTSDARARHQLFSVPEGVAGPSTEDFGCRSHDVRPKAIPSRRKQILTPTAIYDEGVAGPSTADSGCRSDDVRPKTIPSRRKQILTPTAIYDEEHIGLRADNAFGTNDPTPSPSCQRPASPLAFTLPISASARISRKTAPTSHQLIARGSSASSIDSKGTLSSVQSSFSSADTANTELEWSYRKNRSYALQQQLLHLESRFYLGLPKEHYNLIAKCSVQGKMSHRDVMIVLKKKRTDDAHKRLGHDFGLGTSQVGSIFRTCLPKLASLLVHFVVWPTKRSIVLNLPLQFRYRFYNVESIIDGFEIEIEKPSSPQQQSLTWSEYKKCNTIKYLVSCTPRGFINFISEGYGGRISDNLLVQKSGFLDVLPDGCDVLADRGFKQVERLLAGKNCTLIRPPSVGSGEKLSPELVKWSKRISSVRIHVERVISRVREFAFLGPHACIDNNLVPLLDHAVVVACALINLQDPIL